MHNGTYSQEKQSTSKKVVGAVQQDRRGIGWERNTWWSKQNDRGKRDQVWDEVRRMEGEIWMVKAVGQPQQGAWTSWEDTVDLKSPAGQT